MRKRILITGSDGLVGSAIRRTFKDSDYEVIYSTRKDTNLTQEREVASLFQTIKPNYVIHAAAKVGGIGGNMVGHADYFYQNILMNSHVIHYAAKYNVEKLLAFSSVCVFPDDVQTLREDVIHNGPPFTGNFAYAHAKRMVDVQIRAYKSQYGVKNYCSVIPGNIYGTHDLYNLQHGHVIPSLINKIYLAKKNENPLNVWGDGKSLREFIYADDLAKILIGLLELEEVPERLLVSGFQTYSIREVVDMLVEASGFKGEIIYDVSKPNGQRVRVSDLNQLKELFPNYKPIDLGEGLKISYKWFEQNYPNVRL
jgi:GDP-L-fucose synthase